MSRVSHLHSQSQRKSQSANKLRAGHWSLARLNSESITSMAACTSSSRKALLARDQILDESIIVACLASCFPNPTMGNKHCKPNCQHPKVNVQPDEITSISDSVAQMGVSGGQLDTNIPQLVPVALHVTTVTQVGFEMCPWIAQSAWGFVNVYSQ